MKHPLIGVVDAPRKERYLSVTPFAASLRARQAGYDTLLTHSLDLMPKRRLSGLVYNHPPGFEQDVSGLLELKKSGIPVVNMNERFEGISSSVIDFSRGMDEAVSHLKELGHRKIAFMHAVSVNQSAHNRRIAFQSALTKHGLSYDPAMDLLGSWETSSGIEQMRNLLGSGGDCSAIICANDRLAIGCIHAAKRFGYRVPADLAVIGIGNYSTVLNTSDHPLTSVSFPAYNNAYSSADRVLQEIDNPAAPTDDILVDAYLCPRQTTLGDQYRKPTLDMAFSRGRSLMDYILSLGGSLDSLKREELIDEFFNNSQDCDNAFEAFQEMLLSSVGQGFDPLAAHRFILSIGKEWSVWSRRFSSSVSAEQIVDSLFNEVTDNGIYLNRYTEHLLANLQTRLQVARERIIKNPNRESVLVEILDLVEKFEMQSLSLVLFDKPCDDPRRYQGDADLYRFLPLKDWESERIRLEGDLSHCFPFSEGPFPSAFELNALRSTDGFVGIVYLDLDSPYSLFNINVSTEIEVILNLTQSSQAVR